MKPPDATATSVENHGLINRVFVAYEPDVGADHTSGAIFIQGETDVFQSSDSADGNYHLLLDRFRLTDRVAGNPAIGDTSTGLISQDVRNSDSAPTALYSMLFRKGHVTFINVFDQLFPCSAERQRALRDILHAPHQVAEEATALPAPPADIFPAQRAVVDQE